ncbi:MAG: PQQ-binding-like beta-propeller repeat protein, partial [Pseudomonadota bacterium]
CIKWHYTSPVPLRTALTYAKLDERPMLFFGDAKSFTSALDASTGELVWRKNMGLFEASIQTGAVIFHKEKLIVPVSTFEVAQAQDPQHECCKSHGAVHRVDASTGKIEWTVHMTPEARPSGETSIGVKRWGPSGAAVWSTPMVDTKRGVIYIGTGQNTSAPANELSDAVVALNWETGRVVWHYQATAGDTFNNACTEFPRKGPNCPTWAGPDFDFGASIILTKNSSGKEILLAGQKSGDVYALDPDKQGKVIWRTRVGNGSALGGVHWGMAVANNKVFAPANDPPFPFVPHEPGLYVIDIDTGKQLWDYQVKRGCETGMGSYFNRQTVYPDCSFFYGFSAAVSVANDVIFVPALDGKVRAFNTETGELLWHFNTAQAFDSTAGTKAHGGSMDNVGVQFAKDMVYMQSGYSLFGELPGNILLAFKLGG